MPSILEVCDTLLWIYRERLGNPEFWAEPLNALTNVAFLVAAFLAWDFANQRRVATPATIALLWLAGVIGIGSFFFHTMPNRFTMWLDILPIASFQILFLWLAGNQMLGLSRRAAMSLVVAIVGGSFLLLPLHKPLNGSLFYLPSLLAMLTIGIAWSRKSSSEPYLLVSAALCFVLAISARSVDMIVPWRFGSHFIWHVFNGVVVYLALRTWIVFVADTQNMPNAKTPFAKVEDTIATKYATLE